MSDYYDRQGRPMTLVEWAETFEHQSDYKIVEQTTLPNGRWVSTVWLGLNHQYGDGPPLIFETLVFSQHGEWSEVDGERYSTEDEARAGHACLAEKWAR